LKVLESSIKAYGLGWSSKTPFLTVKGKWYRKSKTHPSRQRNFDGDRNHASKETAVEGAYEVDGVIIGID
jgi:hypothetical protein